MNKVTVRCWKIEVKSCVNYSNISLFITYPEDNSGHDLITCNSCGAIYAVSIAKEIYLGPPLQEKAENINCTNCGIRLGGNFSYYPETYVINGKRYSFIRSQEIPPDDESIMVEFEGIYE